MAGAVTGGTAPLPVGGGTPPAATNPATEPATGDGGAGGDVTPLPGPDAPPADDPAPEPTDPGDGTQPPDGDVPPTGPDPVVDPVPTPGPTPPDTTTPTPTPGNDQGPAPVQPNPRPTAGTSPGGTGGAGGGRPPSITPDSLDAASAASSGRPVPAGTPTLADTPVESAESLSTDEILARSNAGMQAAAAAGAGGAASDTGSGSAIAAQLERNLKKDAQGRTIFDRKIESLEGERQGVLAELQRGGDTTELINRLLSITAQQELLQREKEKNTELLRLVVSLMLGNVPTGLVERLCALGLRDVVSRVVADTVGNGRMLGREAIRALHALGSLGIAVSVAPEHQTEDAYREQDQEARRRAATAVDGGQAAALWVRARRTGEADDAATPTQPRATWGPRTSPLAGSAPTFVRWNAASTGDPSAADA